MAKKLTKPQQIANETKYVEFLKKRLEKTKEKYDKAKFKLKTLKM